jgi:hypothetical protein
MNGTVALGLGAGLAEVDAPVLLLAGRVEPPTACRVVRIVDATRRLL